MEEDVLSHPDIPQGFAMAATAATLRTLHRLLGQLAELNDRLQRGPRQIQMREQNVAARKADLEAAQEAERQAKLVVDRKQLDLQSNEQRIADWNVKLNAASSNKEFQTLQDQIAAATMAGSVLADEILEGLERIDGLAEKSKEAAACLESTKQELAKTREQVESAADGIRAEIKRLEGELAEAETRLPSDLKNDYNRVVRVKGADGLAEVDEGVCNGCGQQITPNMQSELILDHWVFCKSCGRLLYLPE